MNDTILIIFICFGTFFVCIVMVYIFVIKINEFNRICMFNGDVFSDESSDSNLSIGNVSPSSTLNESSLSINTQRIGIIEYNSTIISLGEECCICLENYDNTSKIGILECSHVYHYDCIKSWFEKNNNDICPNCMNTGDDRRRLSREMLCNTETA